jgi:outer membrane protein TolC
MKSSDESVMSYPAVLPEPWRHSQGRAAVRELLRTEVVRDAASLLRSPHHCVFLGALAFVLGGCASLAPDEQLSAVQALTKERTGQQLRWNRSGSDAAVTRATVQQVLSRPLSVGDAVQIALINNRGLQATYADLGIADAELVAASWPRNPSISFSHLQGGGIKEIERAFTLDVVGLLAMPLTLRLERDRLLARQLSVASQVLNIAAKTRRAYFRAVAAAQTAKYMEQVQVSANASAELAQRMVKAGNWTKLDQAREKTFYAEATAQVGRAQHAALAAREALTRLLGLGGIELVFQVPERLPDLPNMIAEAPPLETKALENRLDVRAATQEAAGVAVSLGLTKTTRFINVLEAGYKTKSDSGEPLKRGYELSLELPLFDWSDAKIAKAEFVYMQSVDRAAEVATNAESEVREAYSAYRTAFQLARQYRDEVVPLRKQISDENQLRYNGMLISVFELLADAREQVQSVNASIEALRDFWLAATDLDTAVYVGGAAMSPAEMRSGASSH